MDVFMLITSMAVAAAAFYASGSVKMSGRIGTWGISFMSSAIKNKRAWVEVGVWALSAFLVVILSQTHLLRERPWLIF
jgi:hypothetical protein